jgi:hypothetical protein
MDSHYYIRKSFEISDYFFYFCFVQLKKRKLSFYKEQNMSKVIVLIATYCFFLFQFLFAQEIHVPPKTHPNANDWNDLFNADLTNAIFQDGIWTFENDILTASEDQAIWTQKSFNNFILDLEFKTEEGTNSGVIVYCNDIVDWIPNSVEIQIADDFSEKWAKSPKTWQCGAIFGHLAAKKSMVKKPGEWNRCTITCKDTMVYVMLNGELVTEMDMNLWTSAEINPDGTEIPSWLSTPFSEMPTHGYIGFQGKHADAHIYFRNIKIKEIE